MDCWGRIDRIVSVLVARIQNGKTLGGMNRILLSGIPETGKSYVGLALAKAAGIPFWRQTLNPHAGAFDILGMFSPTEKGMKYHLGNAMRAWNSLNDHGARGGIWIADEVDKAGGDLEIAMHAVLDDPSNAALTLPTGQTLKPGKHFICIGTLNGDPDALNSALLSRFPIRIDVNKPNPAAIATLPEDLRKVATGLAAVDDAERRVGLRSWFAFAELRTATDVEFAGETIFGEARWLRVKEAMEMEKA